MAVGYQTTKFDIDQASGNLSRQIATWAESSVRLFETINATPDPDLIDLGYGQSDVNLLRSAVNDMHKLAQVYLGQAEQTPAYDFRVFMNRLKGLTLT